MADPVSPVPPPPAKNSPMLIGCLAVAGMIVAGLALMALLCLLIDFTKTPAQRAAEKAQDAADDTRRRADDAKQLALTLAQGKADQARFATIAAAVAAIADLKQMPCPHSDGDSLEFAPVDAPFMRRFDGAFPRDVSGTAWFRYKTFSASHETDYGSGQAKYDAESAISADEDLVKVARIGVVHTLSLTEPKLLSSGGTFKDGSYDGGAFSGWIQLISYPGGKTICEVPFSAVSSTSVGGGIGIGLRIRGIPLTNPLKATPEQQIENDFQGNFWTAAQAAVDGTAASGASSQ